MSPHLRPIFLLIALPLAAYGQSNDPGEFENTIERVVAIHSRRDTVKMNEVVELQLNTDQDVKSFDSLYINGLHIKIPALKFSTVDKIIYVTFDKAIFDTVAGFIKNEAASTVYVPVYISVANANRIVAKATDPLYMVVRHSIENRELWFSLMVIPFVVLIVLCLRWNILKDDQDVHYSLGRTQLFAWTVIFSACYLFIWLKTGITPDITSSALIILGISAGTTAAAKVIENEHERTTTAAIIAGVPQPITNPSRGWILDILSDRNGMNISVHRFQNVLFTAVFGLIFIQKVISSSVLPDFDDNALILMGISSTTYAGLKITERA